MDIAEIVALLAARSQTLALELLPHGRKDGVHWRCGSIYGEHGNSFVFTLSGAYAGWWKDFSGGARGDALDLIAQVACQGDKRAALRWARRWLGIDQGDARALEKRRLDAADRVRQQQARDADDKARRAGAAKKLWLDATTIDGTPADLYLAGRGIGIARLGRAPRALRFDLRVPCAEVSAELPCLLAAITGHDGAHLATHRTWIETDHRGGWRKASLDMPKKTLGRYLGGTINLWRGKSGRPLRDAPTGDTVAIAEGIEDGLTVACACPDWRVLAAVSVSNLAAIRLPPAITDVVLVLQRDGENDQVAQARAKAERAWLEEGRSVRRALPPEGFKDFNDWWRATPQVVAA